VYYIAILADVALSITAGTSNVDNNAVEIWTESSSYSGGFPTPAIPSETGGTDPNITISVVPNNWSLVSEVLEDGDTTYVYSATVNAKDLYSLSALGVTAAAIAGVEVFLMGKKSDSGPRSISLRFIANASPETDEGTVALSNSYNWITKFLALDPNGASWTQAHAEGATIGVKVIS
jgi:hypothetical protein